MLYLRSINRLLLVTLALLGLSVSSVNAALINYDEGDSGDIANSLDDPSFVLNMAGINTWTGSVSWSSSTTDVDRFRVDLDPSIQIIGYSVTWSDPLAVASAEFIDSLFDYGTVILRDDVQLDGSVLPLLGGPAAPPLALATLFFRLGPSMCFDPAPECSGTVSANYQVTIVTGLIPAVPVPAAVWLFGTALAGLVGFGKRKSRIAA